VEPGRRHDRLTRCSSASSTSTGDEDYPGSGRAPDQGARRLRTARSRVRITSISTGASPRASPESMPGSPRSMAALTRASTLSSAGARHRRSPRTRSPPSSSSSAIRHAEGISIPATREAIGRMERRTGTASTAMAGSAIATSSAGT
jgi:hypothetical protein